MTDVGTSISIHPSERGLRWSSGRYDEIATIDISEDEVITRLGRPLLEGAEEGLGPWKADGFILSTGEMMELILYLPIAREGFILRVDYGVPFDTAIAHFLSAFELPPDRLRWRRDQARKAHTLL